MCNANKHEPGCTCGFGGEGHKGRGGGGVDYAPGIPRQGAGSGGFGSDSMSELAAGLGYSVVFPVLCRFCGRPIWLYANPNGGFAIFNELGGDWPKHKCHGVVRTTVGDCMFPPSLSREYGIFVPRSVTLAAAEAGKPIGGVVVDLKPAPLPTGRWQAHLVIYCRAEDRLYRVMIDTDVQLGAFVTGKVVTRPGGEVFLVGVEQRLPPPPPPRRPPTTRVRIVLGTKDSPTGRELTLYATFRLPGVLTSFAEVIACLRKMKGAAVAVASPRKENSDSFYVNHPTILPPHFIANDLANRLEQLNLADPTAILIG